MLLNWWIFPIGQSGEASRWRVCYQRGLPRLVSWNIEGAMRGASSLSHFASIHSQALIFLSKPQLFQCDTARALAPLLDFCHHLNHLFYRHDLSYHDLLLTACTLFLFWVGPRRQHSGNEETSTNCTDCTFSWGKDTILYCMYPMARQHTALCRCPIIKSGVQNLPSLHLIVQLVSTFLCLLLS